MNLDKLLINIGENNTYEERVKAIEELRELKDTELLSLIHPYNDKKYWRPAAIAIAEIGYPRIKNMIVELLEWLYDMAWPGAIEIFNLLKTIPYKVLIENIEELMDKQIKVEDEDFYGISVLVLMCKIKKKDFSDPKKYELLMIINERADEM